MKNQEKTFIKEGDKVYYDGHIYEAVGSIHCEVCCFYKSAERRCGRPICTRFANTLDKPIVWRHFAPFQPIYLDSIKWSSREQKKYVYEVYKQQIRDYHLALARELSGED